jgi:haloacetate dehalogenase
VARLTRRRVLGTVETVTSLPGFRAVDHVVDGVNVHAEVGGDGPPVLLLHGYPQTHRMWHRTAPALARTHTVVAADLRGYGASDKPAAGPEHAEYAKRAMAADQVGLMAALGFDTFDVVGHDRGARVTHRLALDHPGAVRRAAVLDIVPTRHAYATVDRALAEAYDHWFFLSGPADLPEHLIGLDPERWLRDKLGRWAAAGVDAFDPDAVAAYVEAFVDPACIAATCEDYRAGATIDLEHDDGVTISLQAKSPGSASVTQTVDLSVDFDAALGHRQEAYERLLDDALDGRRHRFAREDTIDQEWRIVEPILDLPDRPTPYYQGTWGPTQAEIATGGWHGVDLKPHVAPTPEHPESTD